MIEVTDEMLKVARSMQSFELMIKRIIELHEANKPKPEPVAYTSRGELEDLFYQAEMKAFSDKSDINDIPLYTTPPTREPLSAEQIDELWRGSDQFFVQFARIIEQAHGIGVTND